LFFSLIALVAVTACASGYRPALDAWRANAPQPFVQQTLDWTRDAAMEPAASASLAPIGLADLASTSTQSVELEIAAAILNRPAAELAPLLAAIRDDATAAPLLADRLDWPELTAAVAARSPAVRAARRRWQATLAQFSQAEYLETLIAQYRSFTRYLNVETGMPLNKQMTQAFAPAASPLGLKGEMIRRQARMARLDWEMALRDALIEAGNAFFDYQYLDRAERTTRENVQLVENLLGVVEDQYRAGSASQADLLKIQTELERQRNALLDVRARRGSAVATINAALDRPADAPLGPPSDLALAPADPDLDALTSLALRQRQEVLLQETKTEITSVAIRMGETMNRPLAGEGFSRFERGMMPEASPGASELSFGAMPKSTDRPAFAQTEAYLTEMRRRLQAEESALADVRARTASLARVWLNDLDIARRQLTLIDEIVLPQNRSAFETLRSAYASGRASFLDLLDTERALVTARQDRDAALRDLNQTLLRRATLTGRLD
jgi:hypothetical protein